MKKTLAALAALAIFSSPALADEAADKKQCGEFGFAAVSITHGYSGSDEEVKSNREIIKKGVIKSFSSDIMAECVNDYIAFKDEKGIVKSLFDAEVSRRLLRK